MHRTPTLDSQTANGSARRRQVQFLLFVALPFFGRYACAAILLTTSHNALCHHPQASPGSTVASTSDHSEAWSFRMCSYNILADKYARSYRHFLYRDVPSGALSWEHRRAVLLAELAHHAPDIICLQVRPGNRHGCLCRIARPISSESRLLSRNPSLNASCDAGQTAYRHPTNYVVPNSSFLPQEVDHYADLEAGLVPLGYAGLYQRCGTCF